MSKKQILPIEEGDGYLARERRGEVETEVGFLIDRLDRRYSRDVKTRVSVERRNGRDLEEMDFRIE